MSRRSYPLNNRGDTIVEVLIAIALVAMVLSGAYISSNRSFQVTQASKERDIALRIAESQIERIRGYKTARPHGTITSNSCMDGTLTAQSNAGAIQPLTSEVLDGRTGNYATACILDSSGNQYSAASVSIPYYAHIEVSSNDYTIHIRWQKAGGGDNQETIMYYRYY